MEINENAGLFIQYSGGKENIISVTSCMTRVRLRVRDPLIADTESLKNLEGVLGVVLEGDQLQIVVGPGKSTKAAEAMSKLLEKETDDPKQPAVNSILENGARRKAAAEVKHATPFKLFLKRIANIFVPLIPAFMGCGLLLAAYEFSAVFAPAFHDSDIGRILGVVSHSVFDIMKVIAGYNAAKEFGGSGVIGAVLAYVLSYSAIDGIRMFGVTFVAGRGGVISVVAVAIVGALFEKKVRSVMPDALDTFVTPLIVISVMTFAGLIVLQPVCGFVSEAVGNFVTYIIYNVPYLAGIASLMFLPLVATGMHHGLIAVNTQLISDFGVTYLLPVCAMAGAGQVGAVLCILLKTKKPKLKQTCINSLPAGILGIGEPLMWGVTIPMGKPFIASCIGGGIGGSAIAIMKVASKIPSLSGIQLSLVTNAPLKYLLGILISYAGGFMACMVLGFDDSQFE